MFGKGKKGGLFDTYLGWAILTVIVLALILIGYFILDKKMSLAGAFIKRFLRIG